MVNGGIKSKERVSKLGEVFTPEHIVKDMLDLVKDESYRIDSNFLEPACGNGNFLVEILRRKLKTAGEQSKEDYNKNVFIAVSSIYAIDIMPDNIKEAKDRMIDIIKSKYDDIMGCGIGSNIEKSIKYILNNNIIWGNTLTGLYEPKQDTEIIIAEWSISDDDDMVVRKDYIFNNLTSELLRNVEIKRYEPIEFWKIHELDKVEKKDRRKASDIFDELKKSK